MIEPSRLVTRTVQEVFDELHFVAATAAEKIKCLAISKNSYANHIDAVVSRFPLFGTSRITSVEHAYVSLSLTTEIERERYRPPKDIAAALARQRQGDGIREALDGRRFSPLEAMESTANGLALLGNAGSGKTTVFKHLALQIARGASVRGRRRLAFFLAVREMSARKFGIVEFASQVLTDLYPSEAVNVIQSLLTSGQVVILLDGLDETDPVHQLALLTELEELRTSFPDAILAVSSRPYSLALGLPGFSKWETLPLDLPQRRSFVLKWFDGVDNAKGYLLLERCQASPELLDLGSSPLLLSIICALFWNDLDIPNDPDELHARAIEGLLGGWDAFRAIARRTPLAAVPLRRRILLANSLAADLFKRGKLVFSAKDLLETGAIAKAGWRTGIDLPAPDELLETLYNDFGLLVERSPGLYSFSHLTLQEYLVAQNIVSSRSEIDLIKEHLKDQQWFRVIALTAKFLHDASDFMEIATTQLNIEAPYDASLLRAMWEARPVCSRGTRLRLMGRLASGVLRRTRGYAEYIFEEGVLIARIRPPLSDGFQSSQSTLPLADCLLDLLKALLASGVSFDELGCHEDEPFSVLCNVQSSALRDLIVTHMPQEEDRASS